MAKEFIFPDLGEGITEGELVRWLVNVGDVVKEDQDVVEVETDKALLPIPSPVAGKVITLNFKEGERVPVGAALMSFEEAGDGAANTSTNGAAAAAPEARTESEESGQASNQANGAPQISPVAPAPNPVSSTTPNTTQSNKQSAPHQTNKLPPLAAPHTRKIARELGVALEAVTGTGREGRITEEDVRNFAKAPRAEAQGTAVGTAAPSPAPLQESAEDFESKVSAISGESPRVSERIEKSTFLRDRRISGASSRDLQKFGTIELAPLKGIRRKISEHMMNAQAHTAMVTHMDEAVVDKLMQLRKEKMEFTKAKGVKLTLLPFLMKACAIALRDHPALNASLGAEEIIYKKYYHFGFAIDTEAGLMVPVIKNVDKKSILHLAQELTELSAQARERSIGREAFQGHSFTITNIGSIGGKAFTPIIHHPDSAILGVGRTYEKAIVEDGKIRAAWVMPLCLTFDHRITDGATAARFVTQVIQYLQDPDLLLLEEGED